MEAVEIELNTYEVGIKREGTIQDRMGKRERKDQYWLEPMALQSKKLG